MERKCNALLISTIVCLGLSSSTAEVTKWSLSSASTNDGSSIVNVTSASILIQPNAYARNSREAKIFNYPKYAFKPRSIPLIRNVEKDDVNKFKSEVLFPGNYVPIANVKSEANNTDYTGQPFEPKAIPLIRGQEFQRRSLDEYEEPIIEKPEGFVENANRRSISDYLGVEDEEAEGEDYDADEDLEDEGTKGHNQLITKGKRKQIKKAGKKLTKYMLPLLMAYKLKFFALIPLLVGGLVLLVGATGMAGFFFALFAATMGLQKGGY